MIVTTTTAIDGRPVSEYVEMVARPGREHADGQPLGHRRQVVAFAGSSPIEAAPTFPVGTCRL
jgi:hypothetical protein